MDFPIKHGDFPVRYVKLPEGKYEHGGFHKWRYGSVSKPCTPVVHIKIAGKWMFIPLKMVLIGIDPYPNMNMGGSINGDIRK